MYQMALDTSAWVQDDLSLSLALSLSFTPHSIYRVFRCWLPHPISLHLHPPLHQLTPLRLMHCKDHLKRHSRRLPARGSITLRSQESLESHLPSCGVGIHVLSVIELKPVAVTGMALSSLALWYGSVRRYLTGQSRFIALSLSLCLVLDTDKVSFFIVCSLSIFHRHLKELGVFSTSSSGHLRCMHSDSSLLIKN